MASASALQAPRTPTGNLSFLRRPTHTSYRWRLSFFPRLNEVVGDLGTRSRILFPRRSQVAPTDRVNPASPVDFRKTPSTSAMYPGRQTKSKQQSQSAQKAWPIDTYTSGRIQSRGLSGRSLQPKSSRNGMPTSQRRPAPYPLTIFLQLA